MAKWMIIAVLAIVAAITVGEIVRRSSQPIDPPAPANAALIEHLKGNRTEPAATGDPVSEDVEFDQGNRINDSREESLKKAKGKINAVLDPIKNN